MFESLFGSEFEIKLDQNKDKIKKLVKKVTDRDADTEIDTAKALKSKKLSLADRLLIIKNKVLQTLGKQKDNVIVIRDKNTFENYINKAIKKGIIAVDTETNNSLDPVTCKLMGLCLYIPGEKQAYIPINHINNETNERLSDQLTEADCAEQLKRLLAANTYIVMHNGKFDYEVIKCTCGIALPPHWDTMIAARLIDENDLAGLKYLYTKFIDPSQKKYDIEELFNNVTYAQVAPEIFALYAATDSMMTYKLYEYQKPILELSENEKLYWVFKNIEMPIVEVTAEMELAGVAVDVDFGEKLKLKYNTQLTDVDSKIEAILQNLNSVITAWRLSAKANEKAKQFQPKKTKRSTAEIEIAYPLIDEKTGLRYKEGKPLTEQLGEPINLASPTQLAILFYDILDCPSVSKKSERGTGEEQLEGIQEWTASHLAEMTEGSSKYLKIKSANELCNLILSRRGIVKLLTTYVDVIPDLAKHWPDGRIRFHLNSMGTDTGRYSSGGKLKFIENGEPVVVSGINIQNIPSHNKEIRMLFKAQVLYKSINSNENNTFIVPEYSEVETSNGWKYCNELTPNDLLIIDGTPMKYNRSIYNEITKEYEIFVD